MKNLKLIKSNFYKTGLKQIFLKQNNRVNIKDNQD